jgi:hypothetical protein
MRLAALTMVYNEPVWAGVWADFYSRQVGAANCFLLDHGSDDGSTEGLEVHVERLARSALDENARAATVSAVAAELLRSYDAVVHSDVDELVLADPSRYRDLPAFAEAVPDLVVTTAGLDVQHLPGEEPPLDLRRPIGEQRHWVRFSAAMCKPSFVRRPVRWMPGFHRCEAEMVVRGLYLLHLRYADLGLGLQRLGRTRSQSFSSPETNLHQRVSDGEFAGMVASIAQLPREAIPFVMDQAPLETWLARVKAAQEGGEPWLTLAGDRLWRLPELWRNLF